MKKYWFILGMLAVLSAALVGCGGGDSVTVTSPPPAPGNTQTGLTMTFSSGKVHVFFGDTFSGLMNSASPADVASIDWVSDTVGWVNSSTVGHLTVDQDGKFFVDITGMPDHDTGTFVVRLKGGGDDWFNDGLWTLSTNASFNAAIGQITYDTR